MKKQIHKDFDAAEFLKLLRSESKMHRRLYKEELKNKYYQDAFEHAIEADVIDWIADELGYFMREGKIEWKN